MEGGREVGRQPRRAPHPPMPMPTPLPTPPSIAMRMAMWMASELLVRTSAAQTVMAQVGAAMQALTSQHLHPRASQSTPLPPSTPHPLHRSAATADEVAAASPMSALRSAPAQKSRRRGASQQLRCPYTRQAVEQRTPSLLLRRRQYCPAIALPTPLPRPLPQCSCARNSQCNELCFVRRWDVDGCSAGQIPIQ